jgi:hypothetical protein
VVVGFGALGALMTARPAAAIEVPPLPVPVSVPPVTTGPITVGPVTVDGTVTVADPATPLGVSLDVDANVPLPNGDGLGADLGLDLDVPHGVNGNVGVQLPNAPPLPSVPAVSDVTGRAATSGAVAPANHAAGGATKRDSTTAATPSSESARVARPRVQERGGESGALTAEVSPARSGIWTSLGRIAARIGPWIVLILLALIVELVVASAMRDRVRGGHGAQLGEKVARATTAPGRPGVMPSGSIEIATPSTRSVSPVTWNATSLTPAGSSPAATASSSVSSQSQRVVSTGAAGSASS